MTRQPRLELVSSPKKGMPAPIPGFSFDEGRMRPWDHLDQVARWRDQADLTPLLGESVFVRFYMKNVGIYSFRFGD